MRVQLADTTLFDALCAPDCDPGRTALIDAAGEVSFGEVSSGEVSSGEVSFGDLRSRVDQRIAEFDLPNRSLVVLAGDNSIEWIVSYLALGRAGHVPIFANRRSDELAAVWGAQGVVRVDGDDVELTRTGVAVSELHPELALLTSTSGSTGSPKLVRLSHRNLVSNASAIAEYLRLTSADRAITSLPLHYCYGLSVLHSHLLVGASVVVTNGSVVDRCFRAAMSEHGVTTLAGVPHTFEMLDRVGPETINTPSLRLLTQAGGRMSPQAVSDWVERTRRWDADFFVMYGQTEATARIAYLPPSLAACRPGAVGVAIPGSTLDLEPVAGEPTDVGELVVSGPGVMMGYATDASDLAVGHEVDRLRTGDLARYHADDGVFEIVGRRSRFVKPFGLRIDLDDVEARLRSTGNVIAVTGDDNRIVAFAPESNIADATALIAEITGLPTLSIRVHDAPIPMTPSGKVDHATMLATPWSSWSTLDPAADPTVDPPGDRTADPTADPVADLVDAHNNPWRGGNATARQFSEVSAAVAAAFAAVLGRSSIRPSDTFVSLGGDSLSYVECSIRIEQILGHVPAEWHLLPIAEFAVLEGPRCRLARLDTTVFLRALGICLVVATHMRIAHVPGGAHTLLAVAGYNLARFMLPLSSPTERIRAGLRTAARAATPTMIWVGAGMLVFGSYSVGTLLLVNNYVGPSSHGDDHWHFWFIEVFVHLVVIATLVLAIPAVGRLDRRHRYVLPLALLAGTLVLRMDWAYMGDWYNVRYRTHSVAWFFVLGWLVQRSRTMPQRVITTLLCLAIVPGFFRVADRDWRIVALLVLLIWVPELAIPRRLIRPLGVLAAASMWIYVSHFSIWPVLRDLFRAEVAYVLTIVSGVVVWHVAQRLLGLVNNLRQLVPSRRLTSRQPDFALRAHT